MRQEISLFVVGLIVVIAGCSIGPTERRPDIDVGIVNVTEETQNGSTNFHGEVAILDSYEGTFRIEDLRVEFRDDSNELMKSVAVGTVRNTSYRQTVSVILATPPEQVLLRASSVETDAEIDAHGLKRNESGVLTDFRQESLTDG